MIVIRYISLKIEREKLYSLVFVGTGIQDKFEKYDLLLL